jgi:hypothetical protein
MRGQLRTRGAALLLITRQELITAFALKVFKCIQSYLLHVLLFKMLFMVKFRFAPNPESSFRIAVGLLIPKITFLQYLSSDSEL